MAYNPEKIQLLKEDPTEIGSAWRRKHHIDHDIGESSTMSKWGPRMALFFALVAGAGVTCTVFKSAYNQGKTSVESLQKSTDQITRQP